MKRAFVSNRFPYLQIGDSIKFEKGLFVATTDAQVAQIEKNDFYGVHIHDRDAIEPGSNEVTAALEMAVAAEHEPRVRQGRRGTGAVRGTEQ